jgi:hypothetical protein
MAVPSRSSPGRPAPAGLLWLAAGLVVAMGGRAAAESPVPGVVSFRVPEDVSGWALDEGSGRLFAALIGGDSVVELDPASGARRARFTVARGPTELFIKGRRLVAACPSTASLDVVDIETNQVDGRVQLAGKGPYALFGSKADNPYVYAICNTGTAWWGGEVFQVDVRALTVRGRTRVQGWRESNPVHVAMSDDGRWIAPDARGVSSPSGADLMAVDEAKPSFLNVVHLHDTFGPIVAGPHNRGWALGASLFAEDLSGPVRTFRGSPVAIHPSLDLVASLTDADGRPLVPPYGPPAGKGPVRLEFQTLSAARTLGAVVLGPLGGEAPQPRPGVDSQSGRPVPEDPFLRFDAARGRLVCAWRQQAFVLDLAKLGIDAPPLLQLAVPSRVAVGVGETLRVPLALSTPALKGKAALKVESGPQGVEVQGDELVWTPAASAAGIHRVVVAARADGSSDSVTIEVRVGLGLVDLGILAQGMAVDSRSPRVVLWGPKPRENGPFSPRADSANPASLVVVDTERGSIVARRELIRDVRCLASVDGAIIYAPAEGTFLYRLDPDPAADPVRAFLDTPARDLAVVPGPRLAVIPQAGRPRFYDPKTLRPVTTDGAPGANATPSYDVTEWNSVLIAAMPGGLTRVGSRIFPPDGGGPLCLTGRLRLPPLFPDPSPTTMGYGQGPEIWGRRVDQQMLSEWRGNPLVRWNSALTTILMDDPVAVLARVETIDPSRGYRVVLEYRDLVQGNVLTTQVLDQGPTGGQPQMPFVSSGSPLFRAVRGKLALALDGRLYLATIPHEAVAQAPVPVHFDYPQAPLTITPGETAEVALRASGGKGRLTFEMFHDVPGVSVDRTAGTLRVSAADVWNARGTKGQYDGATIAGIIPGVRESYQELTGKPLDPDRFAFGLAVSVIARDEEGQEGRLELSMILVVPRQEATAPPPTASAVPAPAPVARPTVGESPAAATDERLRQIEDRLRRNEAVLDSILRKLEALERPAPDDRKPETPKR